MIYLNKRKIAGFTKEAGGINTNDATAEASDILPPKTAYVKGQKLLGTATMDATAKASDIIEGKTAYSGGEKLIGTAKRAVEKTAQEKSVTPTKETQTVTPDSDCELTKVTVNPIPDKYNDTNDATAEAEDIAIGKIAYVKGERIIGTSAFIQYNDGIGVYEDLDRVIINDTLIDEHGIDKITIAGANFKVDINDHNEIQLNRDATITVNGGAKVDNINPADIVEGRNVLGVDGTGKGNIPEGYINPSGTIILRTPGEHNVREFAIARVEVEPSSGESNGTPLSVYETPTTPVEGAIYKMTNCCGLYATSASGQIGDYLKSVLDVLGGNHSYNVVEDFPTSGIKVSSGSERHYYYVKNERKLYQYKNNSWVEYASLYYVVNNFNEIAYMFAANLLEYWDMVLWVVESEEEAMLMYENGAYKVISNAGIPIENNVLPIGASEGTIHRTQPKMKDLYVKKTGAITGYLSDTYNIVGGKIVDSKPTTNITVSTLSALYLYYVKGDNDVFVYMNLGAGNSWYNAGTILAANGVTGLSFQGAINYTSDISADGYYAVLTDDILHEYSNGKFNHLIQESTAIEKFINGEKIDRLEMLYRRIGGDANKNKWAHTNVDYLKMTFTQESFLEYVEVDGVFGAAFSGFEFNGVQAKTIYLTSPIYIEFDTTNDFSGCVNLTKLVLDFDMFHEYELCRNMFSNTPIVNGEGYIYVRDNLVNSVKTRWAALADKIKPISEYQE